MPCPLSPYLFIIYATVLMHDVEQDLKTEYMHIPYVHSSTDPLWDLEYADDVVLMARSSKVMQSIITSIEKHATQLGVHSNVISYQCTGDS